MRIPIENFYVNNSANVHKLWYEEGSFSVQRGNGKFFQISKENTAKNLRGISPKQVEEANKIGYFTIVKGLGSSGNYSINHTCRLLGGADKPSQESNTDKNSSNNNDYACAHNDRPGVSIADIAEHAGNLDFGSAGRDVMDLVSGHESFGGVNQPSSTENSSSSADPSKTG